MAGKQGVGRENLEGLRFGRLICLEPLNKRMSGRSQVYWLCLCDCGNNTEVRPQSLKEGKIVSCGCKQTENYKLKSDNSFCLTDEYKILKDIVRRCNTKYERDGNKNYALRGISVDESWAVVGREGYDNFLRDMGQRPSKAHTIERKDVDGNYCKENCIWTDDLGLQAFNKRPKSTKTGIPGVTCTECGYVVRISKGKTRHYLGFTKSLREAAQIRKDAELKYYGFNLKWEMPNEDE